MTFVESLPLPLGRLKVVKTLRHSACAAQAISYSSASRSTQCVSEAAVAHRSPWALIRDQHRSNAACKPLRATAAQASASSPDVLWNSHVSRLVNLEAAIEDAVAVALDGFAAQSPSSATRRAEASSQWSTEPVSATLLSASEPPTSTTDSSDMGATTNAMLPSPAFDATPDAPAPDIAFVFISSAFADSYEGVVPQLRRRVPSLRFIFGCSGYGVLGASLEDNLPQEVESAPAISLTFARLPQTDVTLTHIPLGGLPDGDASPLAWAQLLGVPAFPERPLSLVVLADPTFSELQNLLEGLDYAFPSAGKLGGLSSAGTLNPNRVMFCWSRDGSTEAGSPSSSSDSSSIDSRADLASSSQAGSANSIEGPAVGRGSTAEASPASQWAMRNKMTGVRRSGAAVLALHGGVTMDLVVAQGCRPLASNIWEVDSMSSDRRRVLSVRSVDLRSASSSGGGGGGGGGTGSKGSESLDSSNSQGSTAGGSGSRSGERGADDGGAGSRDANRGSLAGGGASGSGRVAAGSITPLQALQWDVQAAARSIRSQDALRSLMRNLTLGVAPRGLENALEPHDFLIRAMALYDDGTMSVGDAVQLGQRIRFMVRDRQGAMEDLRAHGLAFKRKELEASLGGLARAPPFGMLLFSCNGRGNALYQEDSYDSRTMASFVPVPPAGFLCNGEIGTVGTMTRLYGFTCAVGVLRCVPEEDGSESP